MAFMFDSLFNDDFDDFFTPVFRPLRTHRFLDDNVLPRRTSHKGKKDQVAVRHSENNSESLINPFYGFGRMDIHENKDNYEVKADLPGIEKENINVNIKDNILTIDCERKEEKKEDDDKNNYHYSERHFGSYKRSMSIPKDINSDKITADYNNGVLTLVLPKTKVPEEKPTKINVN